MFCLKICPSLLLLSLRLCQRTSININVDNNLSDKNENKIIRGERVEISSMNNDSFPDNLQCAGVPPNTCDRTVGGRRFDI